MPDLFRQLIWLVARHAVGMPCEILKQVQDDGLLQRKVIELYDQLYRNRQS
jgi:hypothetical protein